MPSYLLPIRGYFIRRECGNILLDKVAYYYHMVPEDDDADISGWFQCVPNGDEWFQSSGLAVDCGTFCISETYTCGDPCQGQHEDAHSAVCTN